MKRPGTGPGKGAGGITAKSVGDEPFTSKQELARHLRAVPRHRTNDGPDCFKLLVHRSLAPTEKCISPIFFASAASSALSRAPNATPPRLRLAMSNYLALLRVRFRTRRSAPIRSTKVSPIRSQAAGRANAPGIGLSSGLLPKLPP